ncbi:MAG: hypothetical protein WDN29_08320 [Methylovirgula sp.]
MLSSRAKETAYIFARNVYVVVKEQRGLVSGEYFRTEFEKLSNRGRFRAALPENIIGCLDRTTRVIEIDQDIKWRFAGHEGGTESAPTCTKTRVLLAGALVHLSVSNSILS